MSEKPRFFRPIAAPLDVEDAALDRVNSQLGVPTLTKPVAASSTKVPLVRTVTSAPEPERTATEKLTIEIPCYLADELRREALVNRRTTVRHVVMTALKKDGFRVDDADLVPDGRRARGKIR
jgi:hypothetical protein